MVQKALQDNFQPLQLQYDVHEPTLFNLLVCGAIKLLQIWFRELSL